MTAASNRIELIQPNHSTAISASKKVGKENTSQTFRVSKAKSRTVDLLELALKVGLGRRESLQKCEYHRETIEVPFQNALFLEIDHSDGKPCDEDDPENKNKYCIDTNSRLGERVFEPERASVRHFDSPTTRVSAE
jgi:hypothetical protein